MFHLSLSVYIYIYLLVGLAVTEASSGNVCIITVWGKNLTDGLSSQHTSSWFCVTNSYYVTHMNLLLKATNVVLL